MPLIKDSCTKGKTIKVGRITTKYLEFPIVREKLYIIPVILYL